MQGGSSLFAFPLGESFAGLGLFAAEGLGQRWLKHHRHLRLVTLKIQRFYCHMHSSYSVDMAVNIPSSSNHAT